MIEVSRGVLLSGKLPASKTTLSNFDQSVRSGTVLKYEDNGTSDNFTTGS